MGVSRVAYPSIQELKAMGLEGLDRANRDIEREGVRSLEVRWIFSGRLAVPMAGWFGRFPAQAIALADAYLVDPYLPGLSVKVRERRALEVKVYHGSPGLIEVPGRARGRLESWEKWSFPCGPASQVGGDQAGWRTVGKRRRVCWFSRAGGGAVARFPRPGEKPGCAVELAEFRVLGEDWWTLGFEAPGQGDAVRGELDAAAALVFAQALPGGAELGMDESMSYARWLRGQPGIGNNPEA
jgi:hypothetical protein